jgi:hypothetical protein
MDEDASSALEMNLAAFSKAQVSHLNLVFTKALAQINSD